MDRTQTRKRSPLVPTAIALFVLACVTPGIGMVGLMRSAYEEPRVMGTSGPRVMPTEQWERYMLWVDRPGSPVCTARNVTTGQDVPVETVTRHRHEGLRSIARFEAVSAQTELSCTGRRQPVYLTTAYDERWMGTHLVPVLAPFIGFAAAGGLCLSLGLRQPRG